MPVSLQLCHPVNANFIENDSVRELSLFILYCLSHDRAESKVSDGGGGVGRTELYKTNKFNKSLYCLLAMGQCPQQGLP